MIITFIAILTNKMNLVKQNLWRRISQSEYEIQRWLNWSAKFLKV